MCIAGCSGDDYESAVTDIVFYASDSRGTERVDDVDERPAEPDVTDEPDIVADILVPDDVPVTPSDDVSVPPEDTGPIEEPDTGWMPPWTEHDDPTVESCLESFPALCDKLSECGESDPITGFIGDFCPGLVDGNNGALVGYCESVATGVADQAGSVVATTISDFMKGCIENYDCDPASLQKFGEAIGSLATLFGEGGGGDFTDALPVLLDLADMCGGLGGLLPF